MAPQVCVWCVPYFSDNVQSFTDVRYWCVFNLTYWETNRAPLVIEREKPKEEKKNNAKTRKYTLWPPKPFRYGTKNKKSYKRDSKMDCQHHRQACYQGTMEDIIDRASVSLSRSKLINWKINSCITKKQVLISNIFGRKSGEVLLPYCKIGAESERFNRRGSLVRNKLKCKKLFIRYMQLIKSKKL
jgi:hypothetical protein